MKNKTLTKRVPRPNTPRSFSEATPPTDICEGGGVPIGIPENRTADATSQQQPKPDFSPILRDALGAPVSVYWSNCRIVTLFWLSLELSAHSRHRECGEEMVETSAAG
eukprot:7275739-Prymnesium_polylepis.1